MCANLPNPSKFIIINNLYVDSGKRSMAAVRSTSQRLKPRGDVSHSIADSTMLHLDGSCDQHGR